MFSAVPPPNCYPSFSQKVTPFLTLNILLFFLIEPYTQRIIQCLFCCVWLCGGSIMYFRFIVCIFRYFIVTVLYIHSIVNGHKDCFQFGIITYAVIVIFICIYLMISGVEHFFVCLLAIRVFFGQISTLLPIFE